MKIWISIAYVIVSNSLLVRTTDLKIAQRDIKRNRETGRKIDHQKPNSYILICKNKNFGLSSKVHRQ